MSPGLTIFSCDLKVFKILDSYNGVTRTKFLAMFSGLVNLLQVSLTLHTVKPVLRGHL